MNVYNLRFLGSIRTHRYITNVLWLKYLITKNIWIWIFAYKKKWFLCNITKTRVDWAKLWWFLESACPNYPKKTFVYPAVTQVEIYYWCGTTPVLSSDLSYWQDTVEIQMWILAHSTVFIPNDNSNGSWQPVLVWYLKAVPVQCYQSVLACYCLDP